MEGNESCRKREILSIIGSLSHACKAIWAGRSYLRRLIDLSTTVNRLSRRVRLNTMARSDLLWWWEFSQEWNGVAMMVSVNSLSPDIELVTDASGSWGCGAVCGTQWFQLEWDCLGSTKDYGIMAKELLPIVVAAAVCGGSWAGKTVRARCDNQSVMATINMGSCREAEALHLRRCLAFLEAKSQFHIMAVHIRGVDNVVADALSRNRAHVACSLLQGAEQEPVAVPEGRGVEEAVEFFFTKGVASATRRSYSVAWNRYSKFCRKEGRNPLPVSEQGLCRFVSALAVEGLAPPTLKGYLAGVK